MNNYFVLVKLACFAKDGKNVSAYDGAIRLLDSGLWPMYSKTKNIRKVSSGDNIAIYVAGPKYQCIVATAKVASVDIWRKEFLANYPLLMDGIPYLALRLQDVAVLPEPVYLVDKLSLLSFIPENQKKWGVCFMGGCRMVSPDDFRLLTTI